MLQEYFTYTNVIKYLISYMNGSTLQHFPLLAQVTYYASAYQNKDFYQCFSFHFLKLYNLVVNNFSQ